MISHRVGACIALVLLACDEDGGSSMGAARDAATGVADAAVRSDASTGADASRPPTADGAVAVGDAAARGDDAGEPLPPPSGAFGTHWLMGFYDVRQADALAPGAIPWGDLTHLVVDLGPQLLGSDGKSFDASPAQLTIDGASHSGKDALRQLNALARAHGVTPLIHVGGYDAGAIDAMNAGTSPGKVDALVSSLASFCSDLGFAGVDWEQRAYTGVPSATQVSSFFAKLRAAVPSIVIASDTLGADHTEELAPEQGEFSRAIAPHIDYLLIRMTDGIGNDPPWTVWHFLPLYNRPQSDKHLFSLELGLGLYTHATPAIGVAKNKLGVELPMWGLAVGPKSPDSRGAMMTSPSVPLAGPNDWSLFSWGRSERDWPIRRVVSDYVTASSDHWDDDAKASYVSFWPPLAVSGYETETNVDFHYLTFVSYESARAVALKGAYLSCQGVGGAVVRSLNDATLADGSIPTLRALANALRSNATDCP